MVLIGEGEVQSLQEQGLVGQIGREARQDSSIKDLRVLLCDGVGDDAAKRVSSADNFLELRVAEVALTKGLCKSVCNLNFERALDGENGVWFV